jgi:hypothetical protein
MICPRALVEEKFHRISATEKTLFVLVLWDFDLDLLIDKSTFFWIPLVSKLAVWPTVMRAMLVTPVAPLIPIVIGHTMELNSFGSV